MHKIMLSHPLFGSGMEILLRETELFVADSSELEPFLPQLRQAEGFITRNAHPTLEMLEECPVLRVIGIPGVGYQNYDLEALSRMGIALVYCPGMNLRSVAEHAMAMTYSLTKWIPRDNSAVRAGNAGVRNLFDHLELAGCTAGIAGFGAIGRETAALFRANGMEVAVYDPYVPSDTVQALGCRFCATLEELAGTVQILSLHMPALPETYHMFNRKIFSVMQGVYFINCARGSVVEEAALYDALRSGNVAAAGLDVMEREPFDPESPLLTLPNVIVTPHVGGVSAQAAERTHRMVVQSTLSLLDGVAVDNVANPQALEHRRWAGLRRP